MSVVQSKVESMKPQYDIEKVRKAASELVHMIRWHQHRGTMPYDWTSNGHKEVIDLCEALKIDFGDAHLKKQDKRGAWR
jgi:hypothetical protein